MLILLDTGLRRYDGRSISAVLCLVLMLQACAGSPHQFDTLSIAATIELENTPFYPQEDYQCGPAALATVVDQAGVEVSPETLRPLVYLPGREGSLQADMLATPGRYGLLAVQIEASMQALLELVSSGHPVLVLQNLGLEAVPIWHYAVVIGYNLEQRQLYLRSGTTRRLSYSFRRFEQTWARTRHWALVVVQPGEVPVAVTASAWLQAATVLERLQRFDPARQSYLAATRHWPDNAIAWAGAGNSAFALNQFAAADADYRRALALDPKNALLMNNLAAALGEQGCTAEALEVLDCALMVEPAVQRILQETAGEIRQTGRQRADCRRFNCP